MHVSIPHYTCSESAAALSHRANVHCNSRTGRYHDDGRTMPHQLVYPFRCSLEVPHTETGRGCAVLFRIPHQHFTRAPTWQSAHRLEFRSTPVLFDRVMTRLHWMDGTGLKLMLRARSPGTTTDT